MYTIDKESNSVKKLEETTFSRLGFKERDHLQEWIAKDPSVLGEDLLIIQKEFSGWDDTKERLDLLALDTSGNLVVIENKLDDSGRDVTWQAIKYAAYSSTLLKDKILEIYQQYLNGKIRTNKSLNGESMGARERICEFLNVGSISEVSLNEYNSIRIILVANRFRKEITSSALWLNERGIDVRCIEVKPYETGMGLLLSANQIIPTPESSDMMISITNRINEDKKTEQIVSDLKDMYYKYWTQLLIALKKSDYNQFDSVNPSRDNWLQKTIAPGCILTFINVSHQLRVEISFIGDKNTNKVLFDKVEEHKKEITENFGEELLWRRMDDHKASRIQFPWEVDGHDEKQWENYIKWHIDNIQKLEKSLTPFIMTAIHELKKGK